MFHDEFRVKKAVGFLQFESKKMYAKMKLNLENFSGRSLYVRLKRN